MEPNKFENDLRDKLNAREIMPSEKAWDRLDAMLTVAEEKKPNRNYGWLYIAAAVLGFLFMGTVFFSQTEEVIDQGHHNVVLENANQKNIENNQQEILPTASDSNIAAVEPITSTKSNHKNKQNKQNQSSIKINQSITNPVEAVNQVPDNPKWIASNNNPSIMKQPAGDPVGNSKMEQPQKVDELLAAAQNQQINPKTSVKVNAKGLLSEVDQQVNLSFRERMLRRASEVAETVANRNNE